MFILYVDKYLLDLAVVFIALKYEKYKNPDSVSPI